VSYDESARRKFGRILAILLENNIEKLKIQRILTFNELPENFHSKTRQQRFHDGELWLLDREIHGSIILIEPQAVVQKINISQDGNTSNTDGYITEILYKHNNRWKLRSVLLDYRHPIEYAMIEPSQNNTLPVYKIFIDLYYDDFGTYRNVYHSLGGVYLQFGNMSFNMRKKLKNHFVLGFVPFGGNFDDFVKPFIKEMQQLEKGKIFEIQGERCLVIASIGQITADLPQGNDLASVKRHGAIKGCRSCQATKNTLTASNLDIPLIARYHHITDELYNEMDAMPTITDRQNFATEHGLKIQKSILDLLKRERSLQTPQDVYHVTAGKIQRLLNITINSLSQDGKAAFVKSWKSFEYPRQWQKLPNPVYHHDSFMMSDCLRLTMMMPFILDRFLHPNYIKNANLTMIQQRCNVNRKDIATKLIVKCWSVVAETMVVVFKKKYNQNDYSLLQECLKNEMQILSEVIILF
jgi:hypothetical protein